MLRNGIKPMKNTFIFSSLVNIFLLVRMFFWVLPIMWRLWWRLPRNQRRQEWGGGTHCEREGELDPSSSIALRLFQLRTDPQMQRLMLQLKKLIVFHTSSSKCYERWFWSCIIAPGVGDTLLWIPLSRYSTVLSTSGIPRTSWGLIDFVCFLIIPPFYN